MEGDSAYVLLTEVDSFNFQLIQVHKYLTLSVRCIVMLRPTTSFQQFHMQLMFALKSCHLLFFRS